MSGRKAILREMRARDMVKLSKYCLPKFAGLVGEIDGIHAGSVSIVIGVGSRPFLCLDITDAARGFPVLMHKAAKKVIAIGVSQLGELYAMESSAEPSSERWLTRLGFVATDEFIKGERVYRHGSSIGGNRPGDVVHGGERRNHRDGSLGDRDGLRRRAGGAGG